MADNNPNFPVLTLEPGIPKVLADGRIYAVMCTSPTPAFLDVKLRGGLYGGDRKTIRLDNGQVFPLDGRIFEDVKLEVQAVQATVNWYEGTTPQFNPQVADSPLDVVVAAADFIGSVAAATGNTKVVVTAAGQVQAVRIFYTLYIDKPATTEGSLLFAAIEDTTSGVFLSRVQGGGFVTGSIDWAPKLPGFTNYRIQIVYQNGDTVAHDISIVCVVMVNSASQ